MEKNSLPVFIYPEIKEQIMGKVCEVGSKNLLNNYPRLTTFFGANCFSLFLVMSTTKPDNFMELF